MGIANLIGGIPLLIIGIIIRFMKLSGLIAGYNTMPKEEREKYDEEKLTRFTGNMLIAAAVIVLIGGILSFWEKTAVYALSLSWILFIGVIVGGLVYMNTGERFKKK